MAKIVFKHKKQLGQNFLKDANIVNKIITLADIENKKVLEIGLGQGVLTKFLVPQSSFFVGFEIDKKLSFFLKKFQQETKVSIFFQDFLLFSKKDINDLFQQEPFHLVSNLPYYISSQIILAFLKNDLIETATFMLQKELALRIIFSQKNKYRNAFSLMIEFLTELIAFFPVSKNAFFPKPKVDSIVVKLKKKKLKYSKEFTKLFFFFLKKSFTFKRKTLVNNLSNNGIIEKSKLQSILISLNMKINIRAEEIKLSQWLILFPLVKNNFL